MLNLIKKQLRITTTDFDSELESYKSYVEKEIKDLGVEYYEENDPKFQRLVFLYSASQMDFRGKGDWYLKQYEMLRNTMMSQQEYKK